VSPWLGLADAVRAALVVWAVVALAGGAVGDAVALVAMVAVSLVPRAFGLPGPLDLANIGVWVLQALGQVGGFWGRVPWWDTLVHFLLPAVLAPTALLSLIRLDVLPDLTRGVRARRQLGLLLVSFLIAAGFGAGYEIYEWLSDRYGSTTYQPDNDDTMIDTTANALGGLFGATALAVFARRRPDAERR
jgi:hypothetical protein